MWTGLEDYQLEKDPASMDFKFLIQQKGEEEIEHWKYFLKNFDIK